MLQESLLPADELAGLELDGKAGGDDDGLLSAGPAGTDVEGKEGEEGKDGGNLTGGGTRKLNNKLTPHAGLPSIFSTTSDDLLRLIVTYCDVSVLRSLTAAASDREEASVAAAAHLLADVPVDEQTWLRYHACDESWLSRDPGWHGAAGAVGGGVEGDTEASSAGEGGANASTSAGGLRIVISATYQQEENLRVILKHGVVTIEAIYGQVHLECTARAGGRRGGEHTMIEPAWGGRVSLPFTRSGSILNYKYV